MHTKTAPMGVRMHERQRHSAILRAVSERDLVTVSEFVDLLGASPATVRRDLNQLDASGQLRKVRGGAEALEPVQARTLDATPFDDSRPQHAERKRAIARKAAELVGDGESIIVNGGTTTYPMADFLAGRGLHVLTNSFAMANRLMALGGNRVVLPGGEIYAEQQLILSAYERDTSIDHFYASKLFMGAYAIRSHGLIESDPLVVKSEQKLIRQTEELIVLVDSSKFQPRGSLIFCPLERIDRLITDDDAPAEALDMLDRAGVDIIVVPTANEGGGSGG